MTTHTTSPEPGAGNQDHLAAASKGIGGDEFKGHLAAASEQRPGVATKPARKARSAFGASDDRAYQQLVADFAAALKP